MISIVNVIADVSMQPRLRIFDLVQVKKDATAFLLDKDVEKDYSHIKFTVTKLDI